jgi:hypothetical protein
LGFTEREGTAMKAGIFFTGSGPILVLTTYEDLRHAKLVDKLASKGIKKFVACEVDEKKAKQAYGKHFDVVMGDLGQSDDLRVLDYDGHRIFLNFSFKELGDPILFEP